MPAGNLIADAQLQATQPPAVGGAALAFMNPGGVRSPGIVNRRPPTYPYDFTYGNAFTVQPFGNSLVTMTLTAQQIKDLLEQQLWLAPAASCGRPASSTAGTAAGPVTHASIR